MIENNKTFTIGTLAQQAQVNVETIRFYQRKGLLREPNKPYGGIRYYQVSDLEKIRFIKSAQRIGFSLDEIADLLRLEEGIHCEEVRLLAEHKLNDVRAKLADIIHIENTLTALVTACIDRKDTHSCPLISSLQVLR